MKQVIRITEVEEPKKQLKPIKFTYILSIAHGWVEAEDTPNIFEKIVYLGKCNYDGDMFAAYGSSGSIFIFKGYLNDGVY